MLEGTITKALSGFYYVTTPEGVISCRARGKFRVDGTSPLVGDHVVLEAVGQGEGYVTKVLPRRNFFIRPAVANVDELVIMASAVNPVTDPFLIDRVAVIAESVGCGSIVCINKCDLDSGDSLYDIYAMSGIRTIRTSAETGEGLAELREAIKGRLVALTGNSGVGKSSLLNMLCPECGTEVGEVSDRLGRGRHTTRHIELFDIGEGTLVADTPGFASFDLAQMAPIKKEELQYDFPEFVPFIGRCRFDDCAHLKEPGCAVCEAVREGIISPSRHDSYKRLYELTAQFKAWEEK